MLGNIHSPSPADRMHAGGKNEEGEPRSQTEAGFVGTKGCAVFQSFSGMNTGIIILYTLHLCGVHEY